VGSSLSGSDVIPRATSRLEFIERGDAEERDTFGICSVCNQPALGLAKPDDELAGDMFFAVLAVDDRAIVVRHAKVSATIAETTSRILQTAYICLQAVVYKSGVGQPNPGCPTTVYHMRSSRQSQTARPRTGPNRE